MENIMNEIGNETKTQENYITIAGFITNLRKTAKSIVVTLSTSPTRDKKLRDYPSIVFSGDLTKEVEKCVVGSHVIATCGMQTVPYKDERNGRNSYLVGYSIKKQTSIIEEQTGLSVGNSYKDINEGIIRGKVTHFFIPNKDKPNVAIVSIATKVNNRVSFPNVTCFETCVDYVKNKVKVGDNVAAFCYVQTKNDKENNKFYETLVAREFVKVEE